MISSSVVDLEDEKFLRSFIGKTIKNVQIGEMGICLEFEDNSNVAISTSEWMTIEKRRDVTGFYTVNEDEIDRESNYNTIETVLNDKYSFKDENTIKIYEEGRSFRFFKTYERAENFYLNNGLTRDQINFSSFHFKPINLNSIKKINDRLDEIKRQIKNSDSIVRIYSEVKENPRNDRKYLKIEIQENRQKDVKNRRDYIDEILNPFGKEIEPLGYDLVVKIDFI